jgi:hypothetical protein
MTNILQANGLTAFSNVDYDTFKEWDNVFDERFSKLVIGPDLTQEEVFNYGASIMLKDVIAMIENPSTETVKAFKQLTSPSVNVKTIVIVAGTVCAWWLVPRMINRARFGNEAYRTMVRRGREGWKGLL